MIWYRIEKDQYAQPKVEPVSVERFTDTSVWVVGTYGTTYRQNRLSTYYCYYPTFEEAHTQLVDDYTKRLANAEERVTKLRQHLADLHTLKENDDL